MSSTKAQSAVQKLAGDTTAPASRYGHEIRETVETVVFVLVLVSLLRMFGCEAFVIPTGSMATTLLGAHKSATCPQCGYTTTINASDHVQHNFRLDSGLCQNCRNSLDLSRIKPSGGDRVLVSKFLYEGFKDPNRWDVVVFKVPEENKYPDNTFIKRLIGRPGETVGVRSGDIHIKPPGDDGEFQIVRKPPQVMMAVRRLVYDNELQAADLVRAHFPPHWSASPKGNWSVAADGKSFTASPETDGWLTFRQVNRRNPDEAQLITDFEAYNITSNRDAPEVNWVGDLMLDCYANAQKDQGQVLIDVGEGRRRYQAVLDFDKDQVSLQQNGESLATKDWDLGTGSHHLQFANFDDRLTLWINGTLVFGDGIEVDPLGIAESGPTSTDLEPIKIGSKGAAVTISDLGVYRDIYYTQDAQFADERFLSREFDEAALAEWRVRLGNNRMVTFQVPEDSFFMMGDNSPRSSDGREWTNKFVPRHLVLGRALILYWPIWNWKFVR